MKNLTIYIKVLTFSFIALSSVFADEKSLYDFKWLDEDEKVYVIQNKEYVKSGSFGIDLSLIDEVIELIMKRGIAQ